MGRRTRPAPSTTPAMEVQKLRAELSEPNSNVDDVLKRIMSKVVGDSGENITTLTGGTVDIDVRTRGVIHTGSLGLDIALGVGGWPRGRIIEIYGAEASGKTTLALHAIAECQKAGGIAAFIDAEHALDTKYAAALGVNTSRLLFQQPNSGEDALQIVEKLIETGEVDLVVVDSVAALVPKVELEGAIGDSHVGVQARLMGQAMRKFNGCLHRTNCIAIFLNQTRDKVGGAGGYGPQKTTSGGHALKFYATVRIEVARIGSLSQNDVKYGNRVKFDVKKNKVAPPFRQVEVDLHFGKGISMLGEIIDYGVAAEVIQKSGAWYSYGEVRLGQGKDNSVEHLRNNPALLKEIQDKVLNSIEGNIVQSEPE